MNNFSDTVLCLQVVQQGLVFLGRGKKKQKKNKTFIYVAISTTKAMILI